MIAPAAPTISDPDSPDEEPVDLELRIETPENVVLTYTLAGPALRAGAYLIDLAIRVAVEGAVILVLLCAAILAPGAAAGVIMLVMFAFSWWYYTLFEGLWNGRTPGKWALGLRVIQDKGYPITFWSSVGRNLLRAADALGLYAVGFAVMLLNPTVRRFGGESRFKRLGDLLARTVVVCERNVVLPREPVILEKIDPLPRDEVPGPPPPPRTLTLIDQFLGRRHAVSIARGHDIARPLAMSLAKRLRYTGDMAYVQRFPMAFLARVYVTFLRRDDEEEAARQSPPLARRGLFERQEATA